MARLAAPLKFAVGLNVKVASAALMSVNVPWNLAVVSPVPVPVENVRPVVVPSDIVPLVMVNVTSSAAPLASTSAIEIRFAPVKASAVSSGVVTVAGAVIVGASLNAVTE